MTSTFAKKQAVLATACALALGLLTVSAGAQSPNEKSLVLDTRGGPVMSGTGLCWHSASDPVPSWTAGCHAAVPAPIAQYVAPVEPYVAPVAVAAAAPLAVYEKVVFDANVLFDSDKAALRPVGREKLDAFLGKIDGLEAQSVKVVGYADRMGTEGSNQVLSENRVKTVKTYLVSRGIAEDRVQTSAWGETRPSTYAAECKDANNTQNVACMQPDRHVSIEISGSRIAK
jgi:OmpA-OmpF porin, OOP family